jgi:hypothetical protein
MNNLLTKIIIQKNKTAIKQNNSSNSSIEFVIKKFYSFVLNFCFKFVINLQIEYLV